MSVKSIIKRTLMHISALTHNTHGSKILYYHDVYRTVNHKALDADVHMGTPLHMFARHVEIIRHEGYEIVPRITRPKGQVTIMFDDGFRGLYECREFFYEQGICPTVFLPVDFIGDTSKGIMTEAEILELHNHGVNFASHGWTHRPLTAVPDAELSRELADSREHLAKLLGEPVAAICLPLGYFSDSLLERINEAGYTDVYSSIPGDVTDMPHGMFPRNLCQFATSAELRLILRGGNHLLIPRYHRLHNHFV